MVEDEVGHWLRDHEAMVRVRARILVDHVIQTRNVTFVVVLGKPNDGELSQVCLNTLGEEGEEAGEVRTSVGSRTAVDPRRRHVVRPVHELSTVKRVDIKPLH